MTGPMTGKNPQPGQKHLRAINRAIRAASGTLTEQDDALVETLRTLARQMDDAGENPGTRLTACYLAAQRDLAKILQQTRKPARGANPLDELQRRRAERETG